MQDPFDAAEGVVDDVQVLEGFGIDQPGAGTFAPDLDQEGPLAVAEPGGAFRVHSGRPCSGGDGGCAPLQPGRGVDDQGYSFTGSIEIDDFGDVAVEAVYLDVGGGISNRVAGRGVFRIFRGHGGLQFTDSGRSGVFPVLCRVPAGAFSYSIESPVG